MRPDSNVNLDVRTFRLGTDEYVLFLVPLGTPRIPPDVAGRLTSAECDVLRRVLRSESNEAIARARGTSRHTVSNQLAAIFKKLGVSSRWELVARCRRDG